jgi:ABC-type transport system involved in Fe-S cluster assembly fused permease/ATPase subunit
MHGDQGSMFLQNIEHHLSSVIASDPRRCVSSGSSVCRGRHKENVELKGSYFDVVCNRCQGV